MNCQTCRCPLMTLNGDAKRTKCTRCHQAGKQRSAYRAPKVTDESVDSTKIADFMRGRSKKNSSAASEGM